MLRGTKIFEKLSISGDLLNRCENWNVDVYTLEYLKNILKVVRFSSSCQSMWVWSSRGRRWDRIGLWYRFDFGFDNWLVFFLHMLLLNGIKDGWSDLRWWKSNLVINLSSRSKGGNIVQLSLGILSNFIHLSPTRIGHCLTREFSFFIL